MVNNTDKCPHIDIVLATYNGDKYLREQIGSILSQTYINWHLIIRDDGSSDNTVSIIERYRDLLPERIVVLKDGLGRLGASNNFAKLLEHSHADYIMLSDQDDIWLSRKIELTYKKMQDLVTKYGGDVPLLVYTDVKVVDANLSLISNSRWKYEKVNPQSGRSLSRLLVYNVDSGCTIMINRKLRDLSLPIPADVIMHDRWLSLVSAALGKSDYVQEPTALFRLHGKNTAGVTSNASVKAIISQLKHLNRLKHESKEYLIRTQRQAMALSSRYRDLLNDEDFRKISTYANLDSLDPVTKRFYVLRYGFWWSGIIRNLALLLII